ncbi:molecular chaperone [Achromobacter seleniivolatilans]|uniref:Molecular chaperone n=1 Tax=Achromobacter seleniivolatilans TaxID=3047478 RepID=A0ABY9LYW9_9BURK|nr:molecular chaperone [Achromobacter sp. R39]WMD19942.1 molecular chaperone [Achromobacter sp. R39]
MLNSLFRRRAAALVAGVALVWSAGAQAAISLSGTRLIFDAKHKEAALAVRNGNANILVQAWIESNTPGDKGDLPLAVTPPLAKMRPDGQQLLRVLYAGGNNTLPQDKESVFWLNVQEVPEASQSAGSLQVAVLQRIKIFFRPAGLKGNAADSPAALQWRIAPAAGKSTIHVSNPTPFHVSMTNITIGSGKSTPSTMIAPGETIRLPVEGASSNVTFSNINDFGGADRYEVQLSATNTVTAKAVVK